jgi:hypothetical protein
VMVVATMLGCAACGGETVSEVDPPEGGLDAHAMKPEIESGTDTASDMNEPHEAGPAIDAPEAGGPIVSVTCVSNTRGGTGVGYDVWCGRGGNGLYSVSFGDAVCDSIHTPSAPCAPGTPCIVKGPDVALFGQCP